MCVCCRFDLERTFFSVRNRYLNHIRLNAYDLADQEGISFIEALGREHARLMLKNKDETSDPKRTLVWTPEMDKQLVKSLKQVGPAFALLSREFPVCSPEDIDNRLQVLTSRVFLPHEDEIVLDLAASGKTVSAEKLWKRLPAHHSVRYNFRLRQLKANQVLDEKQLEIIKDAVALHGNSFMQHIDIKRDFPAFIFCRSQLLNEWAKLEPIDQKNAIHTFKSDLNLLKVWLELEKSVPKGLSRGQCTTRIAMLKRSPLPEMVERRRQLIKTIGQDFTKKTGDLFPNLWR